MPLPEWFNRFGEQGGFQPHRLPTPMGQPGPTGWMGLNPMSGTPMGPSQFRPGTAHVGPPTGGFGTGEPPATMSASNPSQIPEPTKPVQPPVPPVRPSPALAAFRASVAPQGGFGGAPPTPPQRPAGVNVPQVPAGNVWDQYNETGNAADFVRANSAMNGAGAPQGGTSPYMASLSGSGSQPMGGPGSWLPSASRFGDLIDKDSVAGKLMQMWNPTPRPGPAQRPEGPLPKLFSMFGAGQGAMTPDVMAQWPGDVSPSQEQMNSWS